MNVSFAEYVDILGSRYKIRYGKEVNQELKKQKRGIEVKTGNCCFPKREISIWDPFEMTKEQGDPEEGNKASRDESYIWGMKKTLRHEIVHAFLKESGMMNNARIDGSWALNEEIVDWIAMQGEKIHEAWKQAGALEDDRYSKEEKDDVVKLPESKLTMAVFYQGKYIRDVTDEERKQGIVVVSEGQKVKQIFISKDIFGKEMRSWND